MTIQLQNLLIAAFSGGIIVASSVADVDEAGRAKVEQFVADSKFVEVAIRQDVPTPKFRSGTCIAIRGLIETQDKEQIVDFNLERQEFPSNPKHLEDGRWKAVDVDFASQVLDHAIDFAAEAVPEVHLDPVVTMPLPQLKSGEWGALASHPRLSNKVTNEGKKAVLFRFIDFDVKPGQWYRYRVRLEVQPEAADKFVLAPWSEPTKVIEVKR